MKVIRIVSTGLLLLLLGMTSPLHAFRQGDKQQEDKNKQQPPPKQQEPPRQQQPTRPQDRPQQQPPRQQTQDQQKQQPPPKQQEQPRQQQQQPKQPQDRPQQQPPRQQTQDPQRQQQQPKQQQQPNTTRTSTRQQQSYGGAYHGGVQYTAPTNGGVHPSGVPQHSGQVKSGFSQSRASSWNSDHKSWRDRGGYNGYRIPDNRFGLYFGRDHYFRIGTLPILFVGGFPRFQYDGYWITFVDPWPENWAPDWYLNDDIYLDYTDDGYYLYDRNYPGIGIAVTVSN
jgi:hypothetical protein